MLLGVLRRVVTRVRDAATNMDLTNPMPESPVVAEMRSDAAVAAAAAAETREALASTMTPMPESVVGSPEIRTMSVKSSTPVLPPPAATEAVDNEDDNDSWGQSPRVGMADRLSDIDA